MSKNPLRDPKVKFAYVATKVAVFAVAAAATWPLARVVGPRAWIGLGVFGAVLVIMTAVVLLSASRSPIGAPDLEQAVDESDIDEDFDPEEPFEIPVEDNIDLHSFPPRDVPDVVDAYLETAFEKGFGEVRLIHGRGIGVQRDRVQRHLARHPLVSGFHDAPPGRGGWGATIAYLKRRSSG